VDRENKGAEKKLVQYIQNILSNWLGVRNIALKNLKSVLASIMFIKSIEIGILMTLEKINP